MIKKICRNRKIILQNIYKGFIIQHRVKNVNQQEESHVIRR